MALTLTQLISRVRDNTGRSNTTTTTNARIAGYLNDAQRVLARRWMWRDLMIQYETSLTTGTYRYAFPSDMKECLGLRIIDDASSVWLHDRSKRWLDQYEPYPDGRGTAKPAYYCVDGNYFELFPRPDSDYTLYIRFSRWPTEFATTQMSATCSIDQADDCLEAFATARLFKSLQLFTEAREWTGEFEVAYRDARIQDAKRPLWTPQPDGVIGAGAVGPPSEYWNNADYTG